MSKIKNGQFRETGNMQKCKVSKTTKNKT